eukprot:54930-Eustigmatos_ZCMA.PRE.1
MSRRTKHVCSRPRKQGPACKSSTCSATGLDGQDAVLCEKLNISYTRAEEHGAQQETLRRAKP